MPTEHEFKYVLSMDTDEAYFEENAHKHFSIQQGYLAFSKGMTCRVRSSRCVKKGETKWYLTFKQKVQSRVIEVEKRLDDRDGQDLWSVCVGRLSKDRYVTIDNSGADWEIDFFKNSGDLYFVLAEVELEECSPRIILIPHFIRDNLLYEVPLTDERFGNKRLGDVGYARSIYQKIIQGEIDDDNKKAAED